MPFKKGDMIKEKVYVPPAGEVLDVTYNADTGEFVYLYKFTNEDGTFGERWVVDTQVEAA